MEEKQEVIEFGLFFSKWSKFVVYYGSDLKPYLECSMELTNSVRSKVHTEQRFLWQQGSSCWS